MAVLHDRMDPARADALRITLGLSDQIEAGDVLPPFFHQAYFWDARPAAELGADGHPRVGGLIPDLGLPRRMWAGGRLKFHAPLRCGTPAEKRSELVSAERKEGRSGALALVTLRHEIWQDGALCVTDEQDLIYREPHDPSQPKRTPPIAEDTAPGAALQFSPTLLFRYSALTFNGHRIHYDRDYATGAEGYSGLVVHGPLLAQHLMLAAASTLLDMTSFSFRATAPLMDFETAELVWNGTAGFIRGPDRRLCMVAEAA
ncbi:MAG: MaoC family dehydratase N-terminal domain-containing protein [Pseudomonadota bacterium]